eukprot:TRINITY_DN1609_c0_g2_i4.p1 TRINITY_DN1609_c0_g2~~TRINITY_DN1609_c0_g2_i4.p1  ORF type:complete len:214 (+),score=36.46 TRINITY_DN1609_c0_g2_i4:159-800(+)
MKVSRQEGLVNWLEAHDYKEFVEPVIQYGFDLKTILSIERPHLLQEALSLENSKRGACARLLGDLREETKVGNLKKKRSKSTSTGPSTDGVLSFSGSNTPQLQPEELDPDLLERLDLDHSKQTSQTKGSTELEPKTLSVSRTKPKQIPTQLTGSRLRKARSHADLTEEPSVDSLDELLISETQGPSEPGPILQSSLRHRPMFLPTSITEHHEP